MGTKIFCKRHDLVVQSDERDVMLPVQYTTTVLSWCKQNGINIESPLDRAEQEMVKQIFGVNIWRVRDEQQRSWFLLKWA
jgi:hypothetical protein